MVSLRVPLPDLVESTDDDLSLGITVGQLELVAAEMLTDEKFIVSEYHVGKLVPNSRAEADELLSELVSKGGDFVDKFKAPPVCRVLEDETIDWEKEGESGRKLYKLVQQFFNGYDTLAVSWGLACVAHLRGRGPHLSLRPHAPPCAPHRAPHASGRVETHSCATARSANACSRPAAPTSVLPPSSSRGASRASSMISS